LVRAWFFRAVAEDGSGYPDGRPRLQAQIVRWDITWFTGSRFGTSLARNRAAKVAALLERTLHY